MRAGPADGISLFAQRGFRCFWVSRTLSALAFQVLGVVVGWQVYALTRDALHLGLVGLVQFVPMIVLTLPAGQVADTLDRRIVVRLCRIVEAFAAAVLAVAAVRGSLGTPVVYPALALIGAARAFENPTMAALLPQAVSAAELPSALALSASAMQTATIVGPALGGVLYLIDAGWAFAAVALLYLGAGIAVGVLRPQVPAAARPAPRLDTLLAGVTYIRRQPIVLGAISLDLFAVLLGGATALLPVFAQDVLRTSPVGLGLLRSAPAVGALLTSLVLARRPLRRHVGLTMFGAVAMFGFATIVFGLSTWFPLSLAALTVLGAADVVSVVVRSSLVQLLTCDAMRGRVSAVNSLFVGTSNQLGEFESGLTALWFGAVPAVVLGGLGTIGVALLWSRLFPALRDVQSLGRHLAD